MHFFQFTLTPWLEADFFLSYRQKVSAAGESDGCALVIRKQRFSLIARDDIESYSSFLIGDERFRPKLDELKATMPQLEQDILPRLKTLAQLAVLETREPHPGGVPRRLVVANTHLFYHPKAPHVRLLQTSGLLAQCEALALRHGCKGKAAVVLCGDFNSGPGSGVFDLLVSRSVSSQHPDWARGAAFVWGKKRIGEDADGEEQEEEKEETQPLGAVDGRPAAGSSDGVTLEHGLPLTPVWNGGELEFTNVVHGFHGILDHIFIDSGALTVKSKVPAVSLAEVVPRYGGLPNEAYGSDHLAMACDVQWLPVEVRP